MNRLSIIFSLLFIIALTYTHAQVVIKPFRSSSIDFNCNKQVVNRWNQRISAVHAAPLQLPFFDDFSSVGDGYPSDKRWLVGGGVWINDAMGVEPPSIGVATFDGLNGVGTPYNLQNPFSAGTTDTLTSQYIDLNGLQASNVYLSFYVQAQGVGDPPELEDSLLLQFKTIDQQWVTVWKKSTDVFSPFELTMIPVNQLEYCHANFQFRFRSFSKQSGPFDIWNIDYVYLDKNRSFAKTATVDVAVSYISSSLLKRYTAMPFDQFKVSMNTELADSLFIYYSNQNSIFNVVDFVSDWRDSLNHQSLGILYQETRSVPALAKKKSFSTQPVSTSINKALDSVYLSYRFTLVTGESANPEGFERNDRASRTTILSNYYAYDDGSPEYSVALNQKFGKLAYRYILNQPDQLTHIDIFLVKMIEEVQGQNFNIMVWKRIGDKDTVLYRRNFSAIYPKDRSSFVRYPLGDYIAVKDTFYIGWEQTSDKMLTVGFDATVNSQNHLFYTIGSGWVPFTQAVGSVMMRPVFKKDKVLGIEEDELVLNPNQSQRTDLLFYPNPTSNYVTVGDGIKHVRVCDIIGREVISKKIDQDQQVDLRLLSDGVYLIFLDNGHSVVVKKLLLRK